MRSKESVMSPIKEKEGGWQSQAAHWTMKELRIIWVRAGGGGWGAGGRGEKSSNEGNDCRISLLLSLYLESAARSLATAHECVLVLEKCYVRPSDAELSPAHTQWMICWVELTKRELLAVRCPAKGQGPTFYEEAGLLSDEDSLLRCPDGGGKCTAQ